MRQLDGCRCWLWWRRCRLAEVKVMMEVEPLSTVGNASGVYTSPMAVAVTVLMEAELFEAVDNARGVQMHSADKRRWALLAVC